MNCINKFWFRKKAPQKKDVLIRNSWFICYDQYWIGIFFLNPKIMLKKKRIHAQWSIYIFLLYRFCQLVMRIFNFSIFFVCLADVYASGWCFNISIRLLWEHFFLEKTLMNCKFSQWMTMPKIDKISYKIPNINEKKGYKI